MEVNETKEIVIYLESVALESLRGSPEEVKRANEILDRNWDRVKPYIVPAQKQGPDNLPGCAMREPTCDTSDTRLPEPTS